MPDTSPIVQFHDNRSAHRIGLGTWQLDNDLAAQVVQQAIAQGYRAIDTATIYRNEYGVGQGIAASDAKREDLFITTKVWHDRMGHDLTRAAMRDSLQALGLDYVDLYLIHWPAAHQSQGQYLQAWETMIHLRDEGLAKSIGVCNFPAQHLQRLLDKTGVLPVLNQIELHPRFQQTELRAFHAEHGIQTQAWSPLGQGTLLADPVLQGIARKHGRTAAQVVLRWQVQLGNLAIPKTATPARLAENLDIFGFVLDDDDMQAIAALDATDGRLGPDPDVFPS